MKLIIRQCIFFFRLGHALKSLFHFPPTTKKKGDSIIFAKGCIFASGTSVQAFNSSSPTIVQQSIQSSKLSTDEIMFSLLRLTLLKVFHLCFLGGFLNSLAL